MCDGEHQIAAKRHGVARIHRKIENGDFELHGIDEDRPCIRRQVVADADQAAYGAPQQLIHAPQHVVDLDRAEGDVLFSGERQHLLRQLRTALGRFSRHTKQARSFRIIDPLGRQIDAAQDCREKVIEIMGNAAGQAAERFHFLRVLQLGFRFLAALRFGEQLAKMLLLAGRLGQRHSGGDEQRKSAQDSENAENHDIDVPPGQHDAACRDCS